jgi:UDP-N-acetylmuramoyl-L-alanyl-D-glutamate--2,6-diaminopimelate ligase
VDASNLSELLTDIAASGPEGLATAVTGVAYRSDMARPGDAFFAVPGSTYDGHDFVADAASRGAVVVVAERDVPDAGIPVVTVPDTRIALALASTRFFGWPSGAMRIVGITGTNGKTTTTYILDAILRAGGLRTGLIGTIEARIGDERVPASRTTPESRDLQETLARMRDSGVAAVSMEVSSHAVDLHRVDGVDFAVAAFTNLSQDHLDYHATMEQYFAVKAGFIAGVPVERRVVNVDDEHGNLIAETMGAAWTVGTSERANVRASDVRFGPDSCTFRLATPAGGSEVRLPLTGAHNVSNALIAAGCALALDLALDTIVEGLAAAPQVPGRLERIDEGQDFVAVVDYAHTPDGLANAISAVRGVTSGRVITVFGCGGDRDPDKRPLMGRVAGTLSDVAILTSDNPRSEDPVGIILQVEDGLAGTGAERHVEVDRRRAIALALRLARHGDTVLVAGKGHEDYQIFADRTVHFDDREVVREVLTGSW